MFCTNCGKMIPDGAAVCPNCGVAIAGAVQQAVGEALAYYLEEHPKEAKLIVDKVVLAATARVAARKARESVQRKCLSISAKCRS